MANLKSIITGLTALTLTLPLGTLPGYAKTSSPDLWSTLGYLSPQLEALTQQNNHNNVVCPVGIIQLLGDLFLMADKSSQSEITRFLGQELSHNILMEFIQKLPKNMTASSLEEGNNTYYSGHFILPSEGLDFNEERLTQLKQLNADIQVTDFSNPTQSVEKINQIVDQSTNHKITQILTSQDLNGLKGTLVLLSTLYINSSWRDEFKETKVNFKTKSETKLVNGFTGNTDIIYVETGEIITVLLPAQEDTFLVIQMNTMGSPSPIPQEDIQSLLKADGESKLVKFTMPAFTIENTIDLKQALTSSLPNLLSNQPFIIDLYREKASVLIGKFLQKNKLEVSKNGIEGGSATVMTIRPMAMLHEPKYKEITIDKPFSFSVIKKVNDHQWLPLFTGQIFDPGTQP